MTITNKSPLSMGSIDLGEIKLFSEISNDSLIELKLLMREVSVKKNVTVITQGEKSRSLFIVKSGRFKVFATDENGNQTIFTFLNEGDFFGELSLLDDAPRSASVVAVEDSNVLKLGHKKFSRFLHLNPIICRSLFKVLTNRIRQMDDAICNLASRNICGRLIQVLYNEAKQKEDGSLVTQRLTHQDLAEMIGSSREMVSRILIDLKKAGYISVDKKMIRIEKKLPNHW